jgi:hypothetical protein
LGLCAAFLNLQHLDLYNLQLGDGQGLRVPGGWPHLTSLLLSSVKLTPEAALAIGSALGTLPASKAVEFTDVPSATSLLSHVTGLNCLCLHAKCEAVSLQTMMAIAARNPSLQHVDLGMAPWVESEQVTAHSLQSLLQC